MDDYDVELANRVPLGNAFVLLFESSYVLGFVDSFVLYSLICASRRVVFIDDEKLSKKSCK